MKPYIAIVGIGKIGSLYEQALYRAGYNVTSIDPRFMSAHGYQRPSVASLSASEIKKIQMWIISTPTDTHVETLEKVLSACPDAKILLEKPAYANGEKKRYLQILSAYPQSTVMINDLYAFSPVVSAFKSLVDSKSQMTQLRHVSIELTKNRACDESRGRFLDTSYGDVGYEWFHVHSLAACILGEERWTSSFKKKCELSFNGRSFIESFAPSGLDRVTLASSVRGEITDQSLIQHYRGLSSRLEGGKIPRNLPVRYRIIRCVFEDHHELSLIYEPFFLSSALDARNTHAIFSSESNETFLLQANQLNDALLRQLDLLNDRINPRRELHLAIHEKLQTAASYLFENDLKTRSERYA